MIKTKIRKIFSRMRSFFAPAGLYAAAATTQDPIARCHNFKTQFSGAFDWVPDKYCTAGGLGVYVIQLLLSLAGISAIVFIILGGFWYLTSAGSEEQAEKGRKTLINAVIGLVVVLLASAAVRIIANTITSAK